MPPWLEHGMQPLIAYRQKQLRQAREDLSQRYQAQQAGQHLQHPQAVASYLVTRLPATYAVMRAIWSDLAQIGLDAPQQLIDVGAGPGTASFAALAQWPQLNEFCWVEPNQQMQHVGTELFKAYPEQARLKRFDDFQSSFMASEDNSWLVASYVLNEMSCVQQDKFYTQVLKAKPKLVLLVEPGTPSGFQHLLTARQRFLKQGWHILAPCPQSGICPLSEQDWCHFAVRIPRSSLHRQLKAAQHGHEDEKYAYLALSPETFQSPPNLRILRHPQQAKGHISLNVCDGEQVYKHTISKSQTLYRLAKKSSWGETLPLPETRG